MKRSVVIIEVAVLAIIGVTLGVTVNELRGDGLKYTRKYFQSDALPSELEARMKQARERKANGTTTPDSQPTGTAATDGRTEPAQDAKEESDDSPLPEHPFLVAGASDVIDALTDPTVLFIDARGDTAYEEGHVPGSIQFDYYQAEGYIDAVLQALEWQQPTKVIIYCNGGSCEDSILAARHILQVKDYDPALAEHLYVYEGGWQEYKATGAPIEEGR